MSAPLGLFWVLFEARHEVLRLSSEQRRAVALSARWTTLDDAFELDMTNESHYLAIVAAYARGALGCLELDDDQAIEAACKAGLRLHRFKRTGGLPRLRRVIGALRGLGATRLVDVGSGRGAFL